MNEIADQHRALDRMFATALKSLGAGRIDAEAREAFDDLRDSLESHLSAEETLYFPTIWELRAEFKDRLRNFIREHQHFRGLIHEIAGLMACDETEEATNVLERLKREFGRHEGVEEDALKALDESIRSHDSRS